MNMRRFAQSLLLVTLAVAGVLAQPVGSRPAGGPPPSTTTANTAADNAGVQQTLQEILEEPTTGETYRYDPQGRRDPFQSLVGPAPRLQPGQRPPGIPGFLIDELKLQGVVKTKQGLVAMINGPDNKGYLVHVGDKVLDGEVIRITASSIVFRQEVNDPTQIERYREVVKDLIPEAQRKG
ncbi:MAG TPA: pilus assembly protein PilP [Thermoanaerobaculia bacterium]|jgi:type IV pilus assembly protein PilP|nr:pilus assembly protein PilP [Thermoanaerobaculia bacterium]